MAAEKSFTPFVKWDMYAPKLETNVSYLLLEFKADGELIDLSDNLLNPFRRFLTQSLRADQTFTYYQSLPIKERNNLNEQLRIYKTKFSKGTYVQWLKIYLADYLKRPVNKLEINALYYSFSSENKFYVHTRENILLQ